jgi:hypothetical protein
MIGLVQGPSHQSKDFRTDRTAEEEGATDKAEDAQVDREAEEADAGITADAAVPAATNDLLCESRRCSRTCLKRRFT